MVSRIIFSESKFMLSAILYAFVNLTKLLSSRFWKIFIFIFNLTKKITSISRGKNPISILLENFYEINFKIVIYYDTLASRIIVPVSNKSIQCHYFGLLLHENARFCLSFTHSCHESNNCTCTIIREARIHS